MAFRRLAFFPGGTAAHWDAVVNSVGDVSVPKARRAFVAGPIEGGWQVVQLWDTRDDLERFNRDIYLPAMARVAARGFPEAPVVHDVDTVDAWIGGHRLP
jgi:hypothetical protein